MCQTDVSIADTPDLQTLPVFVFLHSQQWINRIRSKEINLFCVTLLWSHFLVDLYKYLCKLKKREHVKYRKFHLQMCSCPSFIKHVTGINISKYYQSHQLEDEVKCLCVHFVQFTCSFAQISTQSITWMQQKAFMHLDVVKTTCNQHQNGLENGFKTACLARPDGLVWVFQNLLSYWYFYNTTISAAVVWMKMPCWCERSGETGQTGSEGRKATVSQISMIKECRTPSLKAQHMKSLKKMG